MRHWGMSTEVGSIVGLYQIVYVRVPDSLGVAGEKILKTPEIPSTTKINITIYI